MTEPTEETNVGLELPTSDEIPMGDIELGIEPESEPPPYPTKPMTRRALASVLGCSDVNIGKRLRQLREFHPMSLLVEPSGKVAIFDCFFTKLAGHTLLFLALILAFVLYFIIAY